MIDPDVCDFDYDDYPRGAPYFLSLVDELVDRFPHFRCSVFGIPGEMRNVWHREIQSRPFLRLYPHGFSHRKGECRGFLCDDKINQLKRLRQDPRWGNVFKAPWHGYSYEVIQQLREFGYSIAITNLCEFPYPMPDDIMVWSHRDREAVNISLGNHHRGRHVEAHPYEAKDTRGGRKSAITERNLSWWTQAWTPETRWAFAEDLIRPALLKIQLGCGIHPLDGWMNLDPRFHLRSNILDWDYSRLIPCTDNKADIVFTSHTFNYIEDSFYETALLDIWRVLRPGGVLRMAEDRTESGYIWRLPGQRAAGTGEIKSVPTQARILQALRNVGFKCDLAKPGYTISPHKDVLIGDSRKRRYRRGHKFYVEAVKRISIDLSRVRWRDPRATVKGRYMMP